MLTPPQKHLMSGMRPTGQLHLGHLVGVLKHWVDLQKKYKCFFMVADWHAFMGEYKIHSDVKKASEELLLDWLAVGLDIEKAVIFLQSQIPEHLELQMILGAITPLAWLERCPTYKEQLREQTERQLTTYAFLGYPVLQAADMLLYKAEVVPIGEDQLAHLEITREIVRRFHHLYGEDILVEPKPLLTATSRLLGTDNRKMSSSYGNYIGLFEEDDIVRRKVSSMITDPARIRFQDKGHPDMCNVFSYYVCFAPEQQKCVKTECENAKIGCTACKARLADILLEIIRPIREKRKELTVSIDPWGLFEEGRNRAHEMVKKTFSEVKSAVKL